MFSISSCVYTARRELRGLQSGLEQSLSLMKTYQEQTGNSDGFLGRLTSLAIRFRASSSAVDFSLFGFLFRPVP